MIHRFLIVGFCFLWFGAQCQTVGVVDYTDDQHEGYTLFSPTINKTTYLIDECGSKINEWELDSNPGMMGRLTDKGSLIIAKRTISDFFSGGGIGGKIDSYTWDGELEYSLNLATKEFHQHHDFVILPSGNLLALGWERVEQEEALALGREIANVQGLYSERIIEIEVVNKDSFTVVWEWSVMDHLVQNISDTFPNFGEISAHPERINLNFTNGLNPGAPDWLHCNSLDYNPALDQIILNSRNFGEFWIIDHSTTPSESKGSTGGNAGMGGDILYRWGNPLSYESGEMMDKRLFGQHDVTWIPEGMEGAGNIMIFNNGLGRPEGQYSTIEELEPPLNGFNYTKTEAPYGPEEFEIVYGEKDGPESFFSIRISGAQRLENGNTLICAGVLGVLLEIDTNNEIVWNYVNPSGTIITTQGDPAPFNSVFQATKYSRDFAGFEGKDMTAGEKIELGAVDNCNFAVHTEEFAESTWKIFHDVEGQNVVLENPESKDIYLRIYNMRGSFVEDIQIRNEDHIEYATNHLFPGGYVIQIWHANQFLEVFKFIVAHE